MSERVHLLSVDPELAAAVPADERHDAERLVVADVHYLAVGPWTPSLRREDGRGGFGLLVIDGVITREVCLADRRSAELFGPGDVLRDSGSDESLLPHGVEWTVTAPGAVAVLDHRFAAASRRWPGLAASINERLFDEADRLALHIAIAQLARVEQRVLAMLWHLADRWGRVSPNGVIVPLKLTHEALGRLVGAQRPTVSLALTELGQAGSVTRSATGGWLLHPESRELLAPASTNGAPSAAASPLAGLAG